MKYRITGKKGDIGELLSFIGWFVLFIVIVMLILLFVRHLEVNKETKIQEELEEIEGYQSLSVFLRTPVSNKYAGTIGELAVWSYLNNDYTEFGQRAEIFFGSYYGKKWTIKLGKENEQVSSIPLERIFGYYFKHDTRVNQMLPVPGKEEYTKKKKQNRVPQGTTNNLIVTLIIPKKSK